MMQELNYIRCGDYYIPDICLPEESRPIGRWGRMHRDYIKEHNPIRFNDLCLSGELWTYLADLNEQAQSRLELIIGQMKAAEGVTERMKQYNQMAWVDARNAKDGIAQLQFYMSVCPNCEWGMWTNSVQKYVFRKYIDESGNICFMEYNDIPSADGNLDDVNRPTRKSLRNASDDNLLFVFKTCHNHIYINDGMQKQPAFFELLKVIFCKIEDERAIPAPLEFLHNIGRTFQSGWSTYCPKAYL